MPPLTRHRAKALKAHRRLNPRCKESYCGENDLRLCLANYYKMRNQRRGVSERVHFSKEQELSFAQYLVTMNLEGKISANSISSYVVPEIMRRLHEDHGIAVPKDSIRAKYYALRDATKLYIEFKRKGTGMGWDSQKYTFMIDDPRWVDLQQVNKDYEKFCNKNCYIYHILEDVFRSQGATGEFRANFNRSPLNSEEEKAMDAQLDGGRGKGRADIEEDTSGDEVVEVSKGKGKAKKGKGKRKSGDLSSDSAIPSPTAAAQDRYTRVLDDLETIVSRKKSSSSSMGVSVSSPSKSKPSSSKDKDDFEIAVEQLSNLGLPWLAQVRMGTLLKDKMELVLWKSARSDEDRVALVRERGCLPPPPPGGETGN